MIGEDTSELPYTKKKRFSELLVPMDEDLETPEDTDQCGTSNDEENELQYHEVAQQLCEKIDSQFSFFFFFL